MAKTGGFSKADVQIMVESNFEQLNKQLANSNQMLAQMSQIFVQTSRSLDKLNKNLKQVVNVNKTFEKQSKTITTHLRDWMIIIGQARAAFLNLKMVTTDVFGGILKINSSFERLRALLDGLSNETDPSRRLDEVNQKMEYLLNLSKNAPFSIDALRDAFIKLDTAGLAPMSGNLTTLVDAVAAFGGDEESIKRAGVALQQMAGKGVVSMEELRQQLGEAIPTAFKAMARGAGMSMAEFSKQVALGRVEATSAIEGMMVEFERMYGGSSQKMMDTAVGLMSKIRTEFLLLVDQVANSSGLTENMKNSLRDIVEYLGSSEALEGAKSLAAALNLVLEAIKSLVEFFAEWGKWIAYIAGYVLTKNVFKSIASGLNLIKITANGIKFGSFGILIAQLTKAAVKTQSLSAVMLSLGKVFNYLKVALLGLVGASGPLGWLISGLTILSTIWIDNTIDAEKQAAAFKELDKSLQEMQENLAKGEAGIKEYSKGTLEAAKEKVKELTAEIKENNKELQRLNGYWVKDDTIKARIAQLEAEIEAKKQSIALNQQMIDLQRQQKDIVGAGQSSIIQNIKDTYEKARTDAGKIYSSEMDAADQITDSLQARLSAQESAQEKYINAIQEAAAQASARVNEELQKLEEAGINVEPFREAWNAVVKEIAESSKNAIKEVDVLINSAKNKVQAAEELYLKDYVRYQQNLLKGKDKALAGTSSMKAVAKAEAQESLEVYKAQIIKAAKDAGKEITDAELADELLDKALELAKKSAEIEKINAQSEQAKKEESRAVREINEAWANYAKQLDEVRNQLAGNQEVNAKELTLQGKLEAEIQKVSKARREALEQKKEETIVNYQTLESLKALQALEQDNIKLFGELYASQTDNLDRFLDYRAKELADSLKMELGTEEEKARKRQALTEALSLAEKQWHDQNKTELETTVEDWSKTARQMDSVWSNAFENMSDMLYEFTQTGEMNFRDFANSVIQDLTRIGIKTAMSAAAIKLGFGGDNGSGNMLLGLLGMIGKGASLWSDLGFSSASVAAGTFDSLEDYDAVFGAYMDTMHTGGIVGSGKYAKTFVTPEMFAGATKYHSGGVAGLKSDEVPAILQKGEGVFTKDQMKAIGNSKANVTVNVINNTQNDVSAEQSQPRFDGEKLILDVVLKNMNQPGSFRDAMIGATR